MATNVAVCLSFDFDAMSVWLGSLNATSPSAISRGEFGAVATVRLLEMLARWGVKSTWFIPGHTIDTYPDLVRRVADAGHEIGHHNYCHENPIALSLDEEKQVLDRGTETIRRITGKPPEGFRSPAWDLSPHSLGLLLAAFVRRTASEAAAQGLRTMGRRLRLPVRIRWRRRVLSDDASAGHRPRPSFADAQPAGGAYEAARGRELYDDGGCGARVETQKSIEARGTMSTQRNR